MFYCYVGKQYLKKEGLVDNLKVMKEERSEAKWLMEQIENKIIISNPYKKIRMIIIC
jgi:hypothetical protein